jgi:OmcA/MtrC family decaheme c-type cytochrome
VTTNPAVAASGSGLHVTGTLAKMVASGYTARRVITATALCNNCHDKLGNSRAATDAVYAKFDGMSPAFHSGDRNDPTACNFCHTANRVDSGTGWQVNTSTWIHGIHGGSKRTVTYGGAGYDWSTVLYPGQLKDCSQCHLPNTVNYGNGSSGQGGGYTGGTLQSSLLWTTTTTGNAPTAASAVASTNAASYAVVNPQLAKVTNTQMKTSPYVTYGAVYGSAFSTTVNAVSAVATYVQAAATTLVNSPVTSACFACHTDSTATNHMKTNGGVINGVRANSFGTAVADPLSTGSVINPATGAASAVVGTVNPLQNNEGCLACHGQGVFMDAAVIHQTQ